MEEFNPYKREHAIMCIRILKDQVDSALSNFEKFPNFTIDDESWLEPHVKLVAEDNPEGETSPFYTHYIEPLYK